jgi:hydroxypyruvate isomerase
MPRFAANLSMMYAELPFLERFEAAARDGFEAVEYLFPYEHEPAELAARLRANGLRQVLFNGPPGDWEAGEKGLACLAGREQEFRAGIASALRYAEALGCPRVHVMAGLVPEGQERAAVRPTYLENLRWAAAEAGKQGVKLQLEPINTRDIPRFFLNRQDHAHELVQEIGSPHVQVQMDLYHCQVVEGDLAMKIRQYLPTGRVGHIQIAGVPQRHEPDLGELDYEYLFEVIDEVSAACGWDGWVAGEYRPARGNKPEATSQGLDWLRRWRSRVRPAASS